MKSSINIFLLVILLIHFSCKKEELNPNTENQTNSNVDSIQTEEPENSKIISNRPCENGLAGIYPCSGFDLISFIPLDYFHLLRNYSLLKSLAQYSQNLALYKLQFVRHEYKNQLHNLPLLEVILDRLYR